MAGSLSATVSRMSAAALAEIDIFQFFTFAAQFKTDDVRDVHGRNPGQCVIELIRHCSVLREPDSQQALDCFALVSREPHANFHARGRSATEFVLRFSEVFLHPFCNYFRADLLRPEGITEEEAEKIPKGIPIMFEAARNSSGLLARHYCVNLQVEIEWETVRALERAKTLEPTEATPADISKRRNKERDAEVLRLKKEKPSRTAGQIAKLIRQNPEWEKMENGKEFSAGNVRTIINRAKQSGELPKDI